MDNPVAACLEASTENARNSDEGDVICCCWNKVQPCNEGSSLSGCWFLTHTESTRSTVDTALVPRLLIAG